MPWRSRCLSCGPGWAIGWGGPVVHAGALWMGCASKGAMPLGLGCACLQDMPSFHCHVTGATATQSSNKLSSLPLLTICRHAANVARATHSKCLRSPRQSRALWRGRCSAANCQTQSYTVKDATLSHCQPASAATACKSSCRH
jgi:hypothetical protein